MDVARIDPALPPLEHTVPGAEAAAEEQAAPEAEGAPGAEAARAEAERVEDPDRGRNVDLEA